MSKVLFLSLYQVNTPARLTGLARGLGRPATLDDIPDAELDRIAGPGLDWVWFLSVWQTGLASQRVSRTNPEWRREFQERRHRRGLGANHQTGWTGVIARAMHLFATTTTDLVLNLGKGAAFVETEPQRKGSQTKGAPSSRKR